MFRLPIPRPQERESVLGLALHYFPELAQGGTSESLHRLITAESCDIFAARGTGLRFGCEPYRINGLWVPVVFNYG